MCPGVVRNALWDDHRGRLWSQRSMAPEEFAPYLENKVPIGRLCTPEDVAGTAVFLASDAYAYITGQAINISGGSVMH